METDKFKTLIYLVLVPHQDTRGEIRKYSESLLKNGLKGVYNFPYTAPIALLAKPFTADELKTAAKQFRITAAEEKFQTAETVCAPFFPDENNLALLGSRLNLNITQDLFPDAAGKIKKLISPLMIGSYLTPKTIERQILNDSRLNLSFRAAAIANMFWRPFNKDGEIIYKWKIGKLSWLPRTLQK